MPAPYDPKCLECQGTGERDTGGSYPWGWPITVPCDCNKPQIDLGVFMDEILVTDAVILEILGKDD